MTSSKSAPIRFVVPGQPLEARGGTRGAVEDVAPPHLPGGLLGGRLKQSVQLRATRGGGANVAVDAVPGTDVVVIQIAGGPELVLHPETARDLLLAQSGGAQARGAEDGNLAGGIRVPAQLQWAGLDDGVATRGTRGLGGALVSGFHVIANVIKGPAADFTAQQIAKRFDGQVADSVYALDRSWLPNLKEKGTALPQLPDKSVEGPALVLLHGTFSSTQGTFQKLWANHPSHVDRLFQFYGNRVYALDHPTLGASPIDNALTLVRALKPGTRLHLVTHSRGGLVAEVLAKVCANGTDRLGDLRVKGYEKQVEALESLAALVAQRRIKVDRIVRVACPVRGTLLASKRLDAYLSVFKWSLELAGVPVAPALVEFLGAVAQRRADPMLMPGLAAQVPDSPLVRWLHGAGGDLPGDLRVIAGDLAGDSVSSWLKTLLSDAFYWTDNDLVVQTRGMYGGPRRAGGATFLLDQGGQVNHFNYFNNDRSADAIVNALTQSAPQGFQPIGHASWAGKSSTGLRGTPNGNDAVRPAGDLPAVILVPDVLSSHLKIGKERVWLGPRSVGQFWRLDYAAKHSSKVEPDGLVESVYGDLSSHLATTHEVIPFAYDWRRPIEDGARRLAEVVDATLGARGRRKSGTLPVRIVAHGMGGLVVRAMGFTKPDVWKRLLAHDDARILLLGVPNGGSWTPMQVLSGDQTFGGLLQGLGEPMQEQKTRQIMAGFPGFMQLQAGLDDKNAPLATAKTWKTLADSDVERVRAASQWHKTAEQIDSYEWGRPAQDVLDLGVGLHAKLEAQDDAGFGEYTDNVIAVVGTGLSAPDGYDDSRDAFAYLEAVDAGDGYVTTKSALLPGGRTWTLASDHAGLATNKDAFDAYADLLTSGTTRRLTRLIAGDGRGSQRAEIRERRRPSREPEAMASGQTRDLTAAPAQGPSLGNGAIAPALTVRVVNGNLKFIEQPLMLGHYRSLKLTGTEYVVDRLIGGTMNQLVELGQYPDLPGSQKIFLNRKVKRENPWQTPRPAAVIVVGLGEEGKLTPTQITYSVSQGVIAWSQRLTEASPNAAAQYELAATLLGSGGAGVSPGQSALAVAQGVREANLRLIDAGLPTVSELSLIELYLDRATEALRTLQIQMMASAGQYRIGDSVKLGTGALRRPLTAGYRDVEYDFVTAVTQRDERGEPTIAFRLDTKRARSEVHAQAMQGPLLRELVLSASNDRNSDPQIGRTLFQLVVPAEVEPFMGGTTAMVLEVDSGSAGIPWELLDSGAGTRNGADTRPWAIRSKLLRKLRTDDYRAMVIDANADAHILVIGEPQCDPERFPRLPAAREEARAVAEEFTRASPLRGVERVMSADKVKAVIADDVAGPDARTIMNTVLERDWRIVHIAGHGEPPEQIGPVPVNPNDPPQKDGDPRGVVLSNGTFLGPHEIKTMRVVPELVFVNCCHLAARNVGELLQSSDATRYDRARFAAGVAESLIKIGVRCVIASGWAVGDEQAKEFATTFYDHLLNGARFIDAIAEARQAAFALGGNTWAAYQCYGDPDWTFRWETGDAQAPTTAVARGLRAADAEANGNATARIATTSYTAEFAGITSPPLLILALETLATRSTYDDPDPDEQQRRIRYLSGRFGGRWREVGRVAEAFGDAWHAAGNGRAAIRWYRRAVGAADGSATMRATEQLGNLYARDAEDAVNEAAATPRTITEARAQIETALGLLEPLATFRPSVERGSLCGSAWKRRAMIEQVAGDLEAEYHAIGEMKRWYQIAEDLAARRRYRTLFYPALNRMAAELIVDARSDAWPGFDAGALRIVRRSLDAKTRFDPDFWSVAGRTELRILEALARRDLAAEREAIQSEYDDLWQRVSMREYWDSIDDQLDFVLPKYIARASKPEQDAASALMAHVRQLLHRGR